MSGPEILPPEPAARDYTPERFERVIARGVDEADEDYSLRVRTYFAHAADLTTKIYDYTKEGQRPPPDISFPKGLLEKLASLPGSELPPDIISSGIRLMGAIIFVQKELVTPAVVETLRTTTTPYPDIEQGLLSIWAPLRVTRSDLFEVVDASPSFDAFRLTRE